MSEAKIIALHSSDASVGEESQPLTFEDILERIVRGVIRQEIENLKNELTGKGERLIEAEEAAKILCVSTDWLYRRASKLPFTRKLGHKMLRFSYSGLLRWIESRK